MGIVEQYLLKLKTEKRQWRRAAAVLTALSLLVAIGVSWNLRMTGITIANGATCGYEEHTHSEDCPHELILICGYPEYSEEEQEIATTITTDPETEAETDTADTSEESSGDSPQKESEEKIIEEIIYNNESDESDKSDEFDKSDDEYIDKNPEETHPQHVHTDECYQIKYLCEIPEHIHVISCYSDSTADIETAAIWEETLPQLTGQWAEDLVSVAQTQLGYGESELNYILAEDGQTKNGITRYGQWYGNPHGDWSAMFAVFCLNYADIPEESVPWSPGVYNLMRLAADMEILNSPDESIGNNGNILFLDTDENGNADRIVIVSGGIEEEISAIGGDIDNTVKEITLSKSNPTILGYINVQEAQKIFLENNKESDENHMDLIEDIDGNTAETATPPSITLLVEFPDEGIMHIIAQTNNIDVSMYYWQWQYSIDGGEPWIDIEGDGGLVCELEDTEENFYRYYRVQGHRIHTMFRKLTRATEGEQSSGTSENIDLITSDVVAPFSIGKNNNIYTIDVFAIPFTPDGKRFTGIGVTSLGQIIVQNATKISVKSYFDEELGLYQSAYFGSETAVDEDNINTVWRYQRGRTYYLAYGKTNNEQNNRYLSDADSSISLYLRYIPQYTVTFESEGFRAVTEKVNYNERPTLTEPNTWTRDGYTLLGWIINGNEQDVFTYEDIISRPITSNVTYTAKWASDVTVSFNLGECSQFLYPISTQTIKYKTSIDPLPIPEWRSNTAEMSFGGWYLNQELTEPVTSSYEFLEDTILYAKWKPTAEGYFVYFMDFERDGQVPLVLSTYSVTEGYTVSPYTPGNAPEGTLWDGKWYLDSTCTKPYNFAIPVSSMTDYLQGAENHDLYLYPGIQEVCRAIFITNGTKIDPVTIISGGTINLDHYIPERNGYKFSHWTLEDGTVVSGNQVLNETTTFYAVWLSDYITFEAVLRIENANDTEMTQASILGSWYAKSGSQIRVKSTYSGSGNNRTGTHSVVCVLDGVEYPVYTDAALTKKATLSDSYGTYFVYNNTGTTWTDEVNWDDVYTGGELPYSTRPISSAGDTVINFDYMCVRNDIVFTIPNSSAYIDVYKLYQEGLITGSVTFSGTKPNATGHNIGASGVSATNVSWSYTASTSNTGNNRYTLHNMKYNQRIYEVYPVGGTWLTTKSSAFHWYKSSGGDLFSSRRETLSDDFFKGSGRQLTPYGLSAEFETQSKIALMYAVECLKGETADFTINNIGYKVQTQLCEVVNHSSTFSQKDLMGFVKVSSSSYSRLSTTTSKIGNTSVKTLFGTTYWDYYKVYDGVNSLSDINNAYIFYYTRANIGLQFGFAYDSNDDGKNDTVDYKNIAYGENISEYQYAMPNNQTHSLLNREGYKFIGWLDANGHVIEDEEWESMVAFGITDNSTMVFIAKWEKVSNNIVEYYEDRSASEPFESHYFEDGNLIQYPNMTVYPEDWVWQKNENGEFIRFDWDVPMYGEDGTQEILVIDGKEVLMNVIRIYGTWDESHTKVVYDPNAPQGGIPGTAPTDSDEYTIWQSSVPVAPRGNTANTNPDMVFGGWLLDRDGIVYQPGDHVPVRWPRTMIFTAQWTEAEKAVHLIYDANGGIPDSRYPNNSGFSYRKGSAASIWNNARTEGSAYFTRPGYNFTGWNTEPDGSGVAYQPGSRIVLTEPTTVLYAQWEQLIYTLSLYKVDSETKTPLMDAIFGLYKFENGMYVPVQSLTTGVDGRVMFQNLLTETRYKLVEEKPPNGYAIVTKEIYFSLKPTDSMVSLEFYDSSGRVISSPGGVTGEFISGNRHITMYVENLRGYALPSTGGVGTHIYILCGLILTSAPLVYGLSLRRKRERRFR
ncbi:MAG: hypothetical protein E7672_01605 [Ruminococcaceae bacterium]|nr:hypothetical protein [Oscillospiraceae bacterium]